MTSQKAQKHKAEKKRCSQHKPDKLKEKYNESQVKRRQMKSNRKSPLAVSFPYQLYQYRQELKRPGSEFSYLRLAKAKLNLTNRMIADHMNTYNQTTTLEHLKAISRQVHFKKRLICQVERLQQFRALGLKEMILNGKKTVL